VDYINKTNEPKRNSNQQLSDKKMTFQMGTSILVEPVVSWRWKYMSLKNAGVYLPNNMASQSRRTYS